MYKKNLFFLISIFLGGWGELQPSSPLNRTGPVQCLSRAYMALPNEDPV